MKDNHTSLLSALQTFSKNAGLVVAAIGTITFLGWIFNIGVLKTILPGLVSMKTNTAIGFIFGGTCLCLLHNRPKERWSFWVLTICAAMPFVIGLLTLVQYGTGINLGIDELLFKDTVGAAGTGNPNRMAPNTAFNFLLLGAALLGITWRRLSYWFVQTCTFVLMLIALLGLLGYLYQLKKLYGIGSYTQMALHTAFAFLMLSFGILFLYPNRGVMNVITSNHAGGIMAQRLFPALLIIPPMLGWLVFTGIYANAYPVEIGISLVVILNMVVFAFAIWINANLLGRVDRQRQQAEDQSRIDAIAAAQADQLRQTLYELKQTQSQLIQSEKMSSLGQLVAGIAHEINNPVNFIYGNLIHAQNYTQDLLNVVHLYQQHYPNPTADLETEIENVELDFLMEDLPNLLTSMKVGADRIQKIVLSLRNFSRMDEAEMKAVDIHEGIESTLLILQSRLKAKPHLPAIEVIKEYGDLPQIECYAGQLNQVFMNILSNAIDALEEKDSQRTSAELKQNPSEIRIYTEMLNAERVAIQIADNGPGIPEEVQQRLFDPFFTTKVVGKGTGLGLSISYQIVTEKHKGQIRCISQVGEGTKFIIEIPSQQIVLGK